ncbi:MAG: hypothetical protein ACI33N_04500 [Desulfovibrionaceae bacterium]|nr:hypothetical protein [Desulfovibrionaceae bacterium]
MGSIHPFEEKADIAERIRQMDRDDLLDMWVEAQQLGHLLGDEDGQEAVVPPDVEQAIVRELRLRAL